MKNVHVGALSPRMVKSECGAVNGNKEKLLS